MRTNELMLYKHMENGQILQDITFLIENYQNDYYNMEDMKGLLYDAVNERSWRWQSAMDSRVISGIII